MMQDVIFRDLGNMGYQEAWDYQERLLQENLRAKAAFRDMGNREMGNREMGNGEMGNRDMGNRNMGNAVGADGAGVAGIGGETGVERDGLVVVHEGGVAGRDAAVAGQGVSVAGRNAAVAGQDGSVTRQDVSDAGRDVSMTGQEGPLTRHYLLFVEHPPVYTIGKSGHMEHLLVNEEMLVKRGVGLYRTNRGGDITFHGPGQLVGYPILDLELFYTDIGRYLRNIEEVIIRVLASYGIVGDRSAGETGVWIEPGVKGRERKICAIGVRCSRWVTMHGFAFNVNTDLNYFNDIVPCGIVDKQVTSLEKELGRRVEMGEVSARVRTAFEGVFGVRLVER